MKINEIVEVVKGELLFIPKISFVTQIQIDIKKVKEGDLFLSNNLSDIQRAINKGAFCIISENDLSNLDNEIALIKVKDLKNAKLRLIRYFLSNKEVDIYYVDTITAKIFALFDITNVMVFEDLDSFFENIFSVYFEDIDMIIIDDENILDTIATDYYRFASYEKYDEVIVHSLFETTFKYKGIWFKRIKIPYIYLDNLCLAIDFLALSLEEVEKKLPFLDIFKPIFVNRSFEIVDFGKSDKFIIVATPNYEKKELDYIKKYYSYGKTKVIYGCKNISFDKANCLYIKNCKKENIFKKLNNSQIIQPSLF